MPVPIDLDFRPESYFRPRRLEDDLLTRVKGAVDRDRIRDSFGQGRHDEAMSLLGPDGVPEEDRRAREARHPMSMGGSYLPGLAGGEVEIGRIAIASTTFDVTSVYARPGKGRIRYRVVDEYGGDTVSGRPTRSSTRPLTLGQFADFFLEAWPLLDVLGMNFDGDLASSLDFFQAESDFYPDFDRLCRQRVTERFSPDEQDAEEGG